MAYWRQQYVAGKNTRTKYQTFTAITQLTTKSGAVELYWRAKAHWSTSGLRKQTENYLFQRNGYPKNLIRRTMHEMNMGTDQRTRSHKEISLPYVKNGLEVTTRLLQPKESEWLIGRPKLWKDSCRKQKNNCKSGKEKTLCIKFTIWITTNATQV